MRSTHVPCVAKRKLAVATIACTAILASPANSWANPILLKAGTWAAEAFVTTVVGGIVTYGLDTALQELSGETTGTFYRFTENETSFSLEFNSVFNRDLSAVVLSSDNIWRFSLTINAIDRGIFSFASVDSISFDGSANHKFPYPTGEGHGHPFDGGTANFNWAAPNGAELITNVAGVDELQFPAASLANRFNLSGTIFSWAVPIAPQIHGNHWNIYAPAEFSVSTDATGAGTPDDDILSWSFKLSGVHTATPPVPESASTLLLLIFGVVVCAFVQRRIAPDDEPRSTR